MDDTRTVVHVILEMLLKNIAKKNIVEFICGKYGMTIRDVETMIEELEKK